MVQTFIALGIVLFFPPLILVFILPIYFAWISSEGLIYLLWYDVKDGNDFHLYDKNNPPRPKRKTAILLSFLLPFGLHFFYLGELKVGLIQWGLAAIILWINLFYLVVPILYLSPNSLLVVPIISWCQGVWFLFKKH